MFKKIMLQLAIASLAFTEASATSTIGNKAHDAKEVVVDTVDEFKEKAIEIKDKAAETISGMTGHKIAAINAHDAWARPSSNATTSAIYMKMKNTGNKDLVLTHITASDVANKAMLHQTIADTSGITKMVNLDKLVVPAGQEIELKPNGIHIMLTHLKKSLKVGTMFKITLKFDDNSTKVVEVKVRD